MELLIETPIFCVFERNYIQTYIAKLTNKKMLVINKEVQN